jgi:hypothetical protein
MAAWYWLEAEPRRPVRRADLEAAWFDGDDHHPELVAAFDADGDGALSADELRIDSQGKRDAVARRLVAVGVVRPTIVAGLWPYALHHTIATGAFAVRDCAACHGGSSRIGASIDLGLVAYGGASPAWQGDDRIAPEGVVVVEGDRVHFRPQTPAGRYVIGHDRVEWIDQLGILAVLGVVLAAGAHVFLRAHARRRRRSA